jgi:hypothetical protein
VISLDHTQTHTTVGRTPLDEGSDRRRDLYLTTQTLYKRQTPMPPGAIRTHDPSKRSAADLRLRPRGHWDRLITGFMYLISAVFCKKGLTTTLSKTELCVANHSTYGPL